MPPAPPGAASQADTAKAKANAKNSPAAGLQPLPTPQQVISSVPLGRRDPFGQLLPSFSPGTGPAGPSEQRPPEAAAGAPSGPPRSTAAPGATNARSGSVSGGGLAARPAPGRGMRPGSPLPPLQLPKDFSITGVIRSGGITEAVVSYGALSGSLRRGDRGARTTDLLPSGWSVASIDANQGLLTLQKDGRRVQARL